MNIRVAQFNFLAAEEKQFKSFCKGGSFHRTLNRILYVGVISSFIVAVKDAILKIGAIYPCIINIPLT